MPRDSDRSTDYTTIEKGVKHDELMPLLSAMFRDFQELAKKKPEGALNKRKVEIVNRLLRDVYHIIEGETAHAYLDLLDEDDLPQNSDVVLILGQAVAAMEAFKDKYHGWIDSDAGQGWATAESLGIKAR